MMYFVENFLAYNFVTLFSLHIKSRSRVIIEKPLVDYALATIFAI
jgi:hypothetical protein